MNAPVEHTNSATTLCDRAGWVDFFAGSLTSPTFIDITQAGSLNHLGEVDCATDMAFQLEAAWDQIAIYQEAFESISGKYETLLVAHDALTAERDALVKNRLMEKEAVQKVWSAARQRWVQKGAV